MRTHTYEVSKGNDVRAEFVGREVALQRCDTLAELISSGHFENEAAVVAAAESQWLIGARAAARAELGKPEGTLESAAAKANAVKLGTPREAKPSKPKTPAQARRATAAAAGNKIFERMRTDAKYRERAIKAGFVEESDYLAYIETFPTAQPTAQ